MTTKKSALSCVVWTSAVWLALTALFVLTACGQGSPIGAADFSVDDSAAHQAASVEQAAKSDPVYRFSPQTAAWVSVAASDLVDGDLFFDRGTLRQYRDVSPSALLLTEVELAQLAAASAAWDPSNREAVPAAGDVVFVVGEDYRFTLLRDLGDGERFAFQGRLFEARAGVDTLEIRTTGQSVHRVVDTFHGQTDTVFDLDVEDIDGNDVGRLTATAEHPFYLPEIGEYRRIAELKPGDRLLADDGSLRVVRAVTERAAEVDVNNFEVEHAHNYFVRPNSGGAAVLVHNKAARLPEITSSIGRDRLLTREAGRVSSQAQRDIDNLTHQLSRGNTNPGIGNRHLFDGVHEARGRNGGRVYFRNTNDGNIEILGKSDKGNQDRVVNRLRELYGD